MLLSQRSKKRKGWNSCFNEAPMKLIVINGQQARQTKGLHRFRCFICDQLHGFGGCSGSDGCLRRAKKVVSKVGTGARYRDDRM